MISIPRPSVTLLVAVGALLTALIAAVLLLPASPVRTALIYVAIIVAVITFFLELAVWIHVAFGGRPVLVPHK